VDDPEGFLGRVGVDPKDVSTITELQDKVRGKLEALTRNQQRALSDWFKLQHEPGVKAQIKVVTYTYLGKQYIRYVLPELRGLFGFKRARQYLASEYGF
jgi:hypothetical protein